MTARKCQSVAVRAGLTGCMHRLAVLAGLFLADGVMMSRTAHAIVFSASTGSQRHGQQAQNNDKANPNAFHDIATIG